MKKIIVIFLLMLIFITGCANSSNNFFDAPKDFSVSNNVISFTEIEGSKTKAVIWPKGEDNNISYRVVTSGMSLNELNLTPGLYNIYLEITLDGKVAKTNTIEIIIEDINAVKEVGASDMLNSNYVKLIGRNYYDSTDDVVMMYQAGSGFTIRFKGTSLKADLIATNTEYNWKIPYLSIIVDEDYDNPTVLPLLYENNEGVELVKELNYGEHTVSVIKRSEALDSFFGVKNVECDGKLLESIDKERFIEILGDSTIAGYGNETKYVNGKYQNKTSANSNVLKTFAFITAQNLDADYSIVCASGWGLTGSIWTTPQTVNLFETYKRYYATFNNDTNLHEYSSEYYSFGKARNADAVIISVGTNDLYYIEDAKNTSNMLVEERKQEFINKYKELINFINSVYLNTDIFMVYGAMGESRMYSTVEAAYENICSSINNVHLVKLNGDMGAVDNHPSVSSHESMAQVLTQKIKEIKNW